MNNYNKIKHKGKRSTAFDGARVANAPRSGAYLTRTNKSTSTSVDFDIIIDQIDDILASDKRFIKSVRSWLIDYSKKVVYD